MITFILVRKTEAEKSKDFYPLSSHKWQRRDLQLPSRLQSYAYLVHVTSLCYREEALGHHSSLYMRLMLSTSRCLGTCYFFCLHLTSNITQDKLLSLRTDLHTRRDKYL